MDLEVTVSGTASEDAREIPFEDLRMRLPFRSDRKGLMETTGTKLLSPAPQSGSPTWALLEDFRDRLGALASLLGEPRREAGTPSFEGSN